jgi:hypothetical protein
MESEKFLLNNAYGVSEREMELTNHVLHKPLDATELFDMAKGIFENPSKYLGALKLIMEYHRRKKNHV